MQEIIGLLGVKGAGKDTAAAVLMKNFEFQRVAFADALYEEVADAFGVTVQFLGNRDTKELPQDEFRLLNCTNSGFVETVMDIAEEQEKFIDVTTPLSARWVLQLWGTEFRRIREGHDSYWLDRVDEIISANPDINYVITDVRFINEAKYVANKNHQAEHASSRSEGRNVRVRRLELEASEAKERALNGTASHFSEVELLGYPVDFEAFNEDGRPEVLANALINWYSALKAGSISTAA